MMEAKYVAPSQSFKELNPMINLVKGMTLAVVLEAKEVMSMRIYE